ncbi:S8 family serine peptidase [Lysobacter capsici]|uniref:S8 family serine peptidase n=1 Tax=Lysobacter capsici TaxID=435897 RepID=UPI001BFFF7E3|nr:S8 family serine peptidase [Lysobacter capsici]QWF17678.1 S8 family serine peptidase [Lysobacter capsici]
MNKMSSKKFAVLGLAAACATVLLWSRNEAPTPGAPASGALANAAGAAQASGSLPAPGWQSVAMTAATPRNDAQAKLGSGQLLQAVQWLAQDPSASSPSASAANNGSAANGAASRNTVPVAAQIAALDRAGIPLRFRDGEKVKINVDLALTHDEVSNASLLDRATSTLRETLLAAGLQAQQINGSPSLEASVPLARLEWVASLQSVSQVSLMAMSRTTAFSDGATASNIDQLRALGNYDQLAANLRKDLKGEGLTIAIVDHFNNLNGAVKALQDAAEWPKNTAAEADKLTLTRSTSGVFGYRGVAHGNAVTEIAYDIAPAAKFRLYDNTGAADWVSAIQDAANLSAQNLAQGAPRAQVITASLGFNLSAPGDGTGIGSDLKGLYEAIDAAKNNGVIVLNAAGNEAQVHWDGDSTAGAGANVLQDFVVGNVGANGAAIVDSVNPLTIGGQYNGCVPVGAKSQADKDAFEIDVWLGWNDWTSANNTTNADYKLELVRWADEVRRNGRLVTAAGWVAATQSDDLQNGTAGQQPLEFIAYQPPAASKTTQCDGLFNARFSGGGKFGVRITRKTAGVSNFLRLMNAGYNFQYAVQDRSLIHPADAASVITVAALDAATSNLEDYSSRGPVLAAGGARPNGQAAGNAKPDLANFANVDTVSYGDNAFNGTSSATPHVAALALLGLQHQRQLTNATVPAALPANATAQQKADRAALLKQRNVNLSSSVYDSLVYVASTGGNDLGAAGFDASYGNGRLKFHARSEACFLSATYDAAYRSLLPAQANPLPAGQKTYDQLRADNSASCAAN